MVRALDLGPEGPWFEPWPVLLKKIFLIAYFSTAFESVTDFPINVKSTMVNFRLGKIHMTAALRGPRKKRRK